MLPASDSSTRQYDNTPQQNILSQKYTCNCSCLKNVNALEMDGQCMEVMMTLCCGS